jgi:hypothetical protein
MKRKRELYFYIYLESPLHIELYFIVKSHGMFDEHCHRPPRKKSETHLLHMNFADPVETNKVTE